MEVLRRGGGRTERDGEGGREEDRENKRQKGRRDVRARRAWVSWDKQSSVCERNERIL